MAVKQAVDSLSIQIPEPNIQTIRIKVKGTAPLIHHRWSKKAIEMIASKQKKEPNKKREARDPQNDFEESLYIYKKGKFTYPTNMNEFPIEVKFDGVIGIPATWLKQAMVSAVRNVDGLTMTLVRGSVFVKPDNEEQLVPVKYSKLRMRRDMVRIGMGTSDIRYRGELLDWEANVDMVVNVDILSIPQVVNLLKIAGFACGVGEWRPERNGDMGTFTVEASK